MKSLQLYFAQATSACPMTWHKYLDNRIVDMHFFVTFLVVDHQSSLC